jgi:hypothetical protein
VRLIEKQYDLIGEGGVRIKAWTNINRLPSESFSRGEIRGGVAETNKAIAE